MVSYEPLIVTITLCAFLVLKILLTIFYRLCCDSSTKKIKIYYKFCTILFIICALGTHVFDIIHATLNQSRNRQFALNESNYPYISYFRVFADICFLSANLFLYLLFIGRLYFTFQHTQYQLSYKILYLLFIIVITVTCLSIFYIIWMLLQIFGVNLNDIWLTIIMLTYLIFDIIINATLLFLFLRKLKHVIVAQSENNLNQHLLIKKPSNDGYLVDLDTAQLKFINVMTKLTLLSSITIIANELNYVLITIQFIWFTQYSWTYTANYTLRTITLTIAVINVYLNFEINDKFYHRICGSLHIKLYSHFVKDTRKTISKSINEYQL